MYQKILFSAVILFVVLGCSSTKKAQKTNTTIEIYNADQHRFLYNYYEAVRLRDNGLYDQAMDVFLICYDIDSLDAGLNADLAMMYGAIGKIGESKRHFEKAVELQPDNWWYNVRLINMLSGLKNFDRAIELTINLQKTHPYREEVYYMLGTLYAQTQQYDKAIEAYNELEKIVGINESLSIDKIALHRMTENKEMELEEINKLVREFPAEARYKVLVGDYYMQQDMPEKAFEIYQQILSEDPDNAYVYIPLSEYYNSINESEKARDAIITALKNDKLDVETKIEILGLYVEQMISDKRNIDETENLFQLLVDHYPLEERVHAYYTIFLQYMNREEDMINELETILYINPANEAAWIQLIQVAFKNDEYKKAVDLASKAIENLPENPNMYFYKAVGQMQLKEYNEALETSLASLKFFDESSNKSLKSSIYSQIGDIYYNLNDKVKSFEAYEEALKINPGNLYTMNNYAYYLSLEKENLRRAERLSSKTVELEPKNSTFLDTYAWILYQQGSYELAKIYIERALEHLDPDDTEPGTILDHYGDILWMTGNHEKAVESWEKAFDSGYETEELKQKIKTKSLNRE